MPIVLVSHIMSTSTYFMYCIHKFKNGSMQLTSRKHSMVIDIHPHVNFPGSKYVWKLTFRGEEQTQKVINHKEMIECIRARIDLGYEVTDYHSVPVNANLCMCWTMRIFLLAGFTILGANLMLNVLDSNLAKTINERNQSIERAFNQWTTESSTEIYFKRSISTN